MNTENLSIEFEASSVEEAKAKVEELQREFGGDVYITVTLVSGNKDKLLTTLDTEFKKLAAKIQEKITASK